MPPACELPEGHDPDSFVKAAGGDAYRERLAEAPDAVEWLIRRAARENDITSVGIVADPEYLVQGRGKDLAKIYQE